jgi:hypothetical protein
MPRYARSRFPAAWSAAAPHSLPVLQSLRWFVTDGLEWTHLYSWIAKDLSWTQNWHFPPTAFPRKQSLCSYLH